MHWRTSLGFKWVLDAADCICLQIMVNGCHCVAAVPLSVYHQSHGTAMAVSLFVAPRRHAVLWSMGISGNAEAKVVIQPTGSQWVALDDKISALTLQPAHRSLVESRLLTRHKRDDK